MKLKRNDYLELRKGGSAALAAKLVELRKEYAELVSKKLHNELKNLRELSTLRKSVAKIMTMQSEIKESK